MERTSTLRSLSQIKAQIAKLQQQPRRGQRAALEALEEHDRRLNVKLPTGYGKTYLALASYSILKSMGEVNRLLVVFPSDAQLIQFEQSTPNSFKKYAIDGPKAVCDIRFFGANAISKHQKNECQIYAITVQALLGARGMDNTSLLLAKGRWMIVVDEYHHYGIDKPFGKAVNALNHEFLLCMSATPHRPGDDSAFGLPDVSVGYREAVEENAVKPLCGHAYHYKVDAVGESGEVVSFTTEQLIAEAGGDKPENIKKLIIDKKLRWSPKYISPLITNPIDRMLSERIRTGHKLQAIIGAMCVSHAELVCEQVSATYPSLSVDWVGTGDDGKTNEQNAKILSAFAPTDGSDPSLDVLVHVGMAGEGLDTVRVSEVIHLNAAGHNNTNNQENGRAARYLPGVTGHINFDACSGFAMKGYVGNAIMDAMDNEPPGDPGTDSTPGDGGTDWIDLPEEPLIRLIDVECTSIDSGDETVKMMATWMVGNIAGFTKSDLDNPESEVWGKAMEGVRKMRTAEAEQMNEKSTIKQWKDSVDNALSVVAGNVIKMAKSKGLRVEKSFFGDVKKRINGRKKREIGAIEVDVDVYRKHYEWLKRLETQLKVTRVMPEWLL